MEPPLPLSVAIITLNEERNLGRCLASVAGLAAELVVLDSGSTDGTEAMARKFGAKFSTEPWQGHVAQKNLALQRTTLEWVLCLDADESLSPELATAIRKALSRASIAQSGFMVNRLSFYLGAWIRHAWYPEWRLRLVRRQSAKWVGRDPHDRLEVHGSVEYLSGDLFHFSYANLTDHLFRTVRYAEISAKGLATEGFQLRLYHLFGAPFLAFFKFLILKGGWRDGWRGVIIAFSAMFSVFAKYAFLAQHYWTNPISKKTS